MPDECAIQMAVASLDRGSEHPGRSVGSIDRDRQACRYLDNSPGAVGSNVLLWLNPVCSPLSSEGAEFAVKSHVITLLLALILGFVGGNVSQMFRSETATPEQSLAEKQSAFPDSLPLESDTDRIASQLGQMQKKIDSLEARLNQVARNGEVSAATPEDTVREPASPTGPRPAGASDIDYLAAIGVDPDVASDILRRISQRQFRTMELSNLVRTNASSERQRYMEQLRELNENKISLRTELGDETYDQYLFASGKSNRVKVNSVMAGSPAETYGVQPGDVILYYNDKKIIDVRDLQRAALSGEAGGYGNIEILRDGNRMNLMLPNGTMGVQLEPTTLDPGR
jgi:hypothetical protein